MTRAPIINRIVSGLWACGLAALMAACAGVGSPPDETVSLRAQERVDYVVAEHYQEAWEYFSPGHRSGYSLLDFQRKQFTSRVRWTGATVTESNCLSDSCKVKILVEYSVFGALPGVQQMDSSTLIEEDWILVDGNWYFRPKN